MKRKLPLDPFDPATPISRDYQLGNIAWGIFLIGLVVGGYLLVTANWEGLRGWPQIAVGICIIVLSTYACRKLVKSI